MLIPRSGYSGMFFKLINKQYNTRSANHHLYADKYFNVPFVGQNHTNLCGDAAAFMLSRWANAALPGFANLKYQVDGYEKIRKFIKAVDQFKKKSIDKLRDEAVSLFDKYLNPESQTQDNILQFCQIRPDSDEFIQLQSMINQCRHVKQQRDIQFKGLLNRWARHKTKSQGYVVDQNVFDPLVDAIQLAFFRSDSVAEFIKNPRATPVSGQSFYQMQENYGSLLIDCEIQDPTSFAEWAEFMDTFGPVIVARITRSNIYGMPDIGHYIVVTGYVRSSQYLIYHDPWVGPDQRAIYSDLYNAMDWEVFVVRHEFNSVLQSVIGNP
jgi:hypothetical protein